MLLFVEAVLLLLSFVAFLKAVAMLSGWDFESSSRAQYELEKGGYLLVAVIIFFIIVKIALFPFFAHTIDSLSAIVPGAMCGAGVISANDYGMPLLGLKIAILYLCGIWLVLNKKDMSAKNYPFMRKKLLLFISIFVLFILELLLELLYFSNIDTNAPVACCSVIFGVVSVSSDLPFGLDIGQLLILFYLVFLLILVANSIKNRAVSVLANIFFLYVSYYAIVYFFGTYIYELPTHLCPFCLLQKEYYYVGYLLYALLFLGTFFGVAQLVERRAFFYSSLFNLLFVLLCSAYVIVYYMRNGVLL